MVQFAAVLVSDQSVADYANCVIGQVVVSVCLHNPFKVAVEQIIDLAIYRFFGTVPRVAMIRA
jgi:hypothetical protein